MAEDATVGYTPEGPVPEELDDILPSDAPRDHRAHSLVVFQESRQGRSETCLFKYKVPGGNFKFQTTLANLGNSVPAAMRLARACVVMLDGGKSKEDVAEVRNECYSRYKAVLKGKADPKPQEPRKTAEERRTDGAQPTALEKDKAADQMPGNGASLPVRRATPAPEGVPGLDLLDEVPSSSSAAASLKWKYTHGGLYWFYWKENKRPQVTVKACRGWKELAFRIACLLFVKMENDGISMEEGLEYRSGLYKKISEVPAFDSGEGVPPPASDIPKRKHLNNVPDAERKSGDRREVSKKDMRKSKEGKRKGKEATHQPDRKKRKRADQSSSGSSDGSTSSSSSSADSEDSNDAQDIVEPVRGSQKLQTEPWPPKMPPRRVVAKMLARSGLRCPCHFMYGSDCVMWRQKRSTVF